MLHIGCHLSPAKGLWNMAKTSVMLGGDTFQFFARNPRGSKAKPLDRQDADAFAAYLKEQSFAPILVHAPYTLNPCAQKDEVRDFAKLALTEDLARIESMHLPSRRPSGLRKTKLVCNSLAHRTTWLLRLAVYAESVRTEG